MNKSPNLSMQRAKCSACDGEDAFVFFKWNAIPVNCGTLANTLDESKLATRGDIHLAVCERCGLVFNKLYDPSLIEFGNHYEVSLNASPSFRSFSRQTATRLAKQYDLANKLVFEIGCGNGEFLETICKVGKCNGFGIDPSVKRTGAFDFDGYTIRFERLQFDQDFNSNIGDLVVCLSVFEDIRDPAAFLGHLKKCMNGVSIPVYFEVFNGFRTFEKHEPWSVHYEQCNYFSLASLRCTFERNGFRIVDSGYCYTENQYLFVEAVPGGDPTRFISSPVDTAALQSFQDRFQDAISGWNSRLSRFEPGRVVFWGAGGKSITFLNVVDQSNRVLHVVDNNPKRQGKFIPGSGQEVISADRLTEIRPDLVIISNAIYQEEIQNQLAQLGVHCQVEVA